MHTSHIRALIPPIANTLDLSTHIYYTTEIFQVKRFPTLVLVVGASLIVVGGPSSQWSKRGVVVGLWRVIA